MRRFNTILAEQGTLSEAEAMEAMTLMMEGAAEPVEMAAFVMGLRARGETVAELVGFTRAMRALARPVELPDPEAIDVVGTGGDQLHTFNVSTAAALVCAGAGVMVAKHGNRSVSSKSGSADLLEALGVVTAQTPDGVHYCLEKAGIAFLFAPSFHPAMRHVGPTRKALGVRTFFNILGPLCNPAGVKRQLTGAFSRQVAAQMAEILAQLGTTQAWCLHAEDGMDEVSISAPTHLYEVRDGTVGAPMVIAPESFGLPVYPEGSLKGGDGADNATIFLELLSNRVPSPYRSAVLMNAALALEVSGRFSSREDALAAATESLDAGATEAALNRLITVSREAATHYPFA